MTDNKRNLMYFESPDMRGLHSKMEAWQNEHNKRFLSVSIEREGDKWCCIALSNPTEIVLTTAEGLPAITESDNVASLNIWRCDS
jgi:hypothetical protein